MLSYNTINSYLHCQHENSRRQRHIDNIYPHNSTKFEKLYANYATKQAILREISKFATYKHMQLHMGHINNFYL